MRNWKEEEMRFAFAGLTVVALGLATVGASADAVITSGLTGSISYDGWDGLTGTQYPGYGSYPGLSPWPGPMVANEAGSGDGTFAIVSGSGYAATNSLYSPSGGTFSASDPTPLADLETIVFAMSIGDGEAPGSAPVLTVNGTNLGEATSAWTLGESDQVIGGMDVTVSTLAYQWDLTTVASVSSFDVSFGLGSHGTLYALQLEQSDTYTLINPVAVPEPTMAGLLATGGVVLLRRRRTA